MEEAGTTARQEGSPGQPWATAEQPAATPGLRSEVPEGPLGAQLQGL